MSTLAKLRADKRVESVDYQRGSRWESGLVFVNLKTGWYWDQQRAFGCENLKEAWELVRESYYDTE